MSDASALSKICFGCEPLGGTDWGEIDVDAIADAIARALELGIDFFDTADVYGLGLSEERLAAILGSRRHDVLIATKGGLRWDAGAGDGRAIVSRDSSPSHLRRAVEASLTRLRLERIPVYYVHWPDPDTEIRWTFECLMDLKDEGKLDRIGCSNFDAEQVHAACEVAEVSLVQMPINLLGDDLEPDLKGVVEDRGLGIVAYNVLQNGLLTGKYHEHSRFSDDDRRSRLPLWQGENYQEALRRVAEISARADSEGLTVAQYAIAGVLRQPGVVSAIVGIKSRAQLEENSSVLVSDRKRQIQQGR